MNDVFKIHEMARIRVGKYAGMVGTVTDIRHDAIKGPTKQTSLRVQLEGVKDGEAIKAHVWVKRSQVERNHGA